jgi:hypothetical protein
MVVKPEDRPQTLSDWLGLFGKAGQATDVADDEATRFYAKQVEAEEIVPVPPTPNLDRASPVETGVPASPKDAKFKRVGEETGASRKQPDDKKAAEAPASRRRVPETSATAAAKTGSSKTPAGAEDAARKPRTAIMAGAAVALLAVVGVGALTLRGGSSQTAASHTTANAIDNFGAPPASAASSEAPADEAAVVNGTENMTAPQPVQGSEPADTAQALQAERAKTAAAEAQLQALKKAQAKAAAAQSAPGAPTASARKGGKSAASSEVTSTPDTGVTPATLSQFNATVDDARSLAKQVMRKGSGQNVQLAKNYDKYLKTLKDSMRGIQSEREAQKLLKQANQTRAYVVFLQRQPQ